MAPDDITNPFDPATDSVEENRIPILPIIIAPPINEIPPGPELEPIPEPKLSNLEKVQKILLEHNNQESDISVRHPEYWKLKQQI